MSYGIKYTISFPDYFTNTWKIDLLQKDYSGASSDIICSGEPVFIRSESSSNDLFSPVKSKSCEIEVISVTAQQYFEIFNNETSSTDEWQVKIYKDAVLRFWGWVSQELYQEPLLSGRYKIRVNAIDGLAYLKNIEFKQSTGISYSGHKKMLDIIQICLDNTGISLDYIVDSCNIYPLVLDPYTFLTTETAMATSPLNQIYVDCAAFRQGKVYDSCFTVLEKVLKTQVARISQEYNSDYGLCWQIDAIALMNSSYSARVVNTVGNYSLVDTITIDPTVTLTSRTGSPLNVFVDHSALQEIDQNVGKIKYKRELGFSSNMIKDTFGFNALSTTYTLDEDNELLNITAKSSWTESAGIKYSIGRVDFTKLKNMTLAFTWIGSAAVDFHVYVYYESGGVKYYYNNNPSGANWNTSNIPVYTVDGNSGKIEAEIAFEELPASSYDLFVLFQPTGTGGATVDLSTLSLVVSYEAATPKDYTVIYTHSTNKREKEYTFELGDFSSYVYGLAEIFNMYVDGYSSTSSRMLPVACFKNLLTYYHDSQYKTIYFWFRSDEIALARPLIYVINSIYIGVMAVNRIRLSGTVLGQFSLGSVLYYDTRKYLIDNWELSVKKAQNRIVAMEFASDTQVLITESGEFEIITEDGNNIEI